MNSGKNKQMQAYDAKYAGKQLAAQGGGGQSRNNSGQGNPVPEEEIQLAKVNHLIIWGRINLSRSGI